MENKDNQDIPLVSFLVPVYNAAEYLMEALDSIRNQSYQNLQIVLINDGSTDNSADIIKKIALQDSRIVFEENPANKGLIYTLNKGLKICTGKYIARMDADDTIHPQRIEKQVAFLQKNSNYAAVSSWMQMFDVNGKGNIVKYRIEPDEIKATIHFYSPVSHAASLFTAEILQSYAYRAEYKFCEDYDLWFRIMQNHLVGVIPEVLYNYRTHGTQTTNSKNQDIIRLTQKKIARNLFDYLSISYTNDTIDFHLNYCMQNQIIESKNKFIKWDQHLRLFLNKQTPLIKDLVFIHFVFVNYWQNAFANWHGELNIFQLSKVLMSPFCKFSIITKFKYILKKLLNK